MFRFWKTAPETVSIRPALETDLAECADIHAQCFTHNWDEHTLATMLAGRGTFCLLATSSGTQNSPAGFLMFRRSAGEAEILTVAVNPARRNTGIAGALVDEMIRLCLHERLEEIFLEVDESNGAALSVYRKKGFKKVGERRGYYQAGKSKDGGIAETGAPSNALIMRLDLKA